MENMRLYLTCDSIISPRKKNIRNVRLNRVICEPIGKIQPWDISEQSWILFLHNQVYYVVIFPSEPLPIFIESLLDSSS